MMQIINCFQNFIVYCLMKQNLFALLIAAVMLSLPSSFAAACTVCHSKNPKMVNMHKALGFKDCFVCHGPSSKRTIQPQAKQMTSDPLCVTCHSK